MKIFYVLNIIMASVLLVSPNDNADSSQQFRAVWSSPWGGDADLITFISKEDFIEKMTYILDTLKKYNMNTIIYHVRTHNDALYQSKYNPVSPYFEKVDFKEFDPLKWMVNESHKRGIDFHAWMNPYRIKSGVVPVEEIIEKYKNFENPANDTKNILIGKNCIFMDPGLEIVRNFIDTTIQEFLEQFDVDAIHFDDYFYDDMGAGGKTEGEETILDEQDQNTYEDYIKNHPDCKYDSKNAVDKANWRREQVDELIILLSNNIREYNKKNNKKVQFGISPTGIYKNGDGVVTYDNKGNAITTGSNTNGQEHYASYLFCDSLNWINNGWIDYILPQSYWAQDHPLARYKNVMGWWNKVVEYKKVNLFSGVGLYMADLSGNTYGWQNNENELCEQLTYTYESKNIDGVSIYNFNTLRKLRDGVESKSATQVKNGMIAWQKKVPPSEIKSFERIELSKPENMTFKDNILSFNKVNGAKYYIIYRSELDITFDAGEIVDIFKDDNETVNWIEKDEGNYNYGVKALSYTNTLGDGATIVKQ